MAKLKEKETDKETAESRLLLKVTGKLDHGGKDVLKADSTGYRILAEFVRRVNAPPSATPPRAGADDDQNATPYFDGVVMLDDRRLLRRITLSLAGRLPTESELVAVGSQGLEALPALLDSLMDEDAFYDRLREGFNDIFLTVGYDGVPERVLSYEHFSTTREWTSKYDLSHIADEKERQQARYKLAADYRKAILGEPMKLIEYIVRYGRPFTEIVTADYVMVTPYTARGYGIYEELRPIFKNADDPFEYVPVKLKALVARTRNDDQDSASGFYPHAGLLSTFQYLRRYPTTETNRNRLRVRMFYQHFLGIDALELAARVSDAAAASAKYENPIMQASECVVCHKTIDPVAGLFQDYYNLREGLYGRRKDGWYKDMFGPGFEGEDLPPEERWRALQWLGERTAKDPRFAATMVEHVYYILTGRKVLLPPKELDDPLYAAKRRAYQEQHREVEAIAVRFAQGGFNLKSVFKDWAVSTFYRADGLAKATENPQRQAELEDVGLVRMLAPEQIERKVAAIFGERWGKLNDPQLGMLYGGIDSKAVTVRAADPSGAMGAIQRILANEVARRETGRDFAREPAERRLFPGIEPDVVPGASPDGDSALRRAIVHLHERVLGRYDTVDSPEVERTWQLFAGIVSDAQEHKALLAPANLKRQRNSARPAIPMIPITRYGLGRASSRTCFDGKISFTSKPIMRRDFLKLCGAASLNFLLPIAWPAATRAESKDKPYGGPYYLVFNAQGGWDTTYLMDPKGINDINRLYQEGDIQTRGEHKFAPTAKHIQGGMSNEDFYAEFGDELLVLNGLDYSVNNHSPGERYMATGKLDSMAYPTFAALVAACQGPACPLSFLTFGNYSATGNLVPMSRVLYMQSLKRIANADAMNGDERSPYHDSFVIRRIEQAAESENLSLARSAAAARRLNAGARHVVCGPGQFEGARAGHALHPGHDAQRTAFATGRNRPGVIQSRRLRLGESHDWPVRQPQQ